MNKARVVDDHRALFVNGCRGYLFEHVYEFNIRKLFPFAFLITLQ